MMGPGHNCRTGFSSAPSPPPAPGPAGRLDLPQAGHLQLQKTLAAESECTEGIQTEIALLTEWGGTGLSRGKNSFLQ